MSIYYPDLAVELESGHPVTGPYSADNQIAADQLNEPNIQVGRDEVTGSQIMNATDDGEYTQLAPEDRGRWLTLCNNPGVDVSSGIAKAEEQELFGPGTNTRASLSELKIGLISRATELGWPEIEEKDVAYARARSIPDSVRQNSLRRFNAIRVERAERLRRALNGRITR